MKTISLFKTGFCTLLVLSTIPCQLSMGQVSTNKAFFLGTNNSLRPNETNFFAVNSNLLNASVAPSSGGGGGGGGNSNYFAAGTNLVIVTNAGASGATNIISVAAAVLTNNEAGNVGFAANLTVGNELFANETLITNLNALYATISPTSGVGLTINGDGGGVHNIMQLFSFSSSGEFMVDNAGNATTLGGAYFKGNGAGLTNLPGYAFAPGTTITGSFSGNAAGATNLNNLAFAGPTQAVTNGEASATTLNGPLTVNAYQTNGATIFLTASSLHPALSLASAGQTITLGYGANLTSTGPANFGSFSDFAGFSTSSGVVTANEFIGSAAGLTNIPTPYQDHAFSWVKIYTDPMGVNSNWQAQGGNYFTFAGGQLNVGGVPNDSSVFGHALVNTNLSTIAQYYKWTGYFSVTNSTNQDCGIGFGFRSGVPQENDDNILAYFRCGNAVYQGGLNWFGGASNAEQTLAGVSYTNAAAAGWTYATNQVFAFTLVKWDMSWKFALSNETTHLVQTITWYNTNNWYPNNHVGNNPFCGMPAIFVFQAVQFVEYSNTFYIGTYQNPEWVVLGDSHVTGLGCTNHELCFMRQLQKQHPGLIAQEAASGLCMTNVLQNSNLLYELTNYYHPTKGYICELGYNDMNAIGLAEAETSLTNVVTNFLKAGASNFYVVAPKPNTAPNPDFNPLVNFIFTNWPNNAIDNYSPLLLTGSVYINPIYVNANDNTSGQHVNDGPGAAASFQAWESVLYGGAPY